MASPLTILVMKTEDSWFWDLVFMYPAGAKSDAISVGGLPGGGECCIGTGSREARLGRKEEEKHLG